MNKRTEYSDIVKNQRSHEKDRDFLHFHGSACIYFLEMSFCRNIDDKHIFSML